MNRDRSNVAGALPIYLCFSFLLFGCRAGVHSECPGLAKTSGRFIPRHSLSEPWKIPCGSFQQSRGFPLEEHLCLPRHHPVFRGEHGHLGSWSEVQLLSLASSGTCNIPSPETLEIFTDASSGI